MVLRLFFSAFAAIVLLLTAWPSRDAAMLGRDSAGEAAWRAAAIVATAAPLDEKRAVGGGVLDDATPPGDSDGDGHADGSDEALSASDASVTPNASPPSARAPTGFPPFGPAAEHRWPPCRPPTSRQA